MQNEKIEYEFIATSKVISHIMGVEAAVILATLMYKYRYWENEDKLTSINGFKGFHISHSDIKEETCLGLSVIKRRLKNLIEKGLIKTKRQGLTKPNLYSLDEAAINQYIEDHEEDYKTWRKTLREDNRLERPVNTLIGQNELSGKANIDYQDGSISTTTKNKNTKNKTIRTITNRINADMDVSLLEEDLLVHINGLKSCFIEDLEDLEELEGLKKELYDYLVDSFDSFKKFTMSEGDMDLMEVLVESQCEDFDISSKILSNLQGIIEGRKPVRFGNLFVGLQEMEANMAAKLAG